MRATIITLQSQRATVDKFPNKCPQCHQGIHVADTNKAGENILNNAFQVVFKCPCCFLLFICLYYKNNDRYMLHSCQPSKPEKLEIDDSVMGVSLFFCEIYNQAHAAEQFNLNQIAGLGYRKALEFLVKDFCIMQSPDDAEKIKSISLVQCINRLENLKIKQAAERAAWLGNDEAHYEKKFEDKDITDLKNLLKIVQAHIIQEVMLKKYTDEMNKK